MPSLTCDKPIAHSKQFQIKDKIQLRMFVEKKSCPMQRTFTLSIKKQKTITAHIGKREFRRHFNQIRHYTENRGITL